MELAVCPYNATHLMPKEETKSHLERCPDRRIVEVQQYNVPLPGQHGYLRNPTVYGSSFIKSNEDTEIQDQMDVESTMSSMNRSRILRNALTRNAPRPLRSPALNESICSKEIQNINDPSGRSTPRNNLRRPTSIEEPLQYNPSPLVGRVFSTTLSLISNDVRSPLPRTSSPKLPRTSSPI